MKRRKIQERKKSKGRLKKVGNILSVILLTIASLLLFSARWMFATWANLSMDELVYHLKAPLEGTNTDMIKTYCLQSIVPTVIILLLSVSLLYRNRKSKKKNIISLGYALAAIGILVTTVGVTWSKLDVSGYMKGQNTYSTFIDKNYVDPASVKITFPEQKRNLIYIFLESMEMTYADKKNRGAFEKNTIPELTKLAEENEDFSENNKKLNGGIGLSGTGWTMGAMFGQTSGLPLSISIDGNAMSSQDSFFPGVTTLGDILKQEGYSQTLLIGSDATFGGRRLYFEDHGSYEIEDYNYALENNKIPEGYKVWWGYEDQKLFGFAKEKLQELSQKDEPFNLTMLTVDTHFEDGYVCDLCEDKFGDNQYANVMACSSKQVKAFIDWVEQQDFADNTTIVISGDHPTMDKDFCQDVPADYQRKVYTTYINASAQKEIEGERVYSTFDNFPTTIAALGAEIEGERLGLGTNLYSSKQTLTERLGVEKEQSELLKKSKLLNKLAKIDKKKYNKYANENYAPEGEIKIKEYKAEEKILPLRVKNIQYVENGVKDVKVAIWKNEDESDKQWFSLALFDNNVWKADADMSLFEDLNGEYKISAYIDDGKDNSYCVAQTTATIE